jgi:hypothetical protein
MENNIKAIHRSEERYATLILIPNSEEQRGMIRDVVGKEVPDKHDIEISEIMNNDGKLETRVEFHDDYNKQSGPIFNKIMKSLKIENCD